MRDYVALSSIMGGPSQVLEADETYIGGKAKNCAHRELAKKKAVTLRPARLLQPL